MNICVIYTPLLHIKLILKGMYTPLFHIKLILKGIYTPLFHIKLTETSNLDILYFEGRILDREFKVPPQPSS